MKYSRYIAIIALLLIGIGVAVKMYEKVRPATAYFNYYGNVTTKTEYHYPERIESYAFGVNENRDTHDILFENQLYCRSFDSNDVVFISVDAVVAPDYRYWNELDVSLLSRSLVGGVRNQRISERLADRVRRDGASGEYGTWGLNNAYPVSDGICHIVSIGSIETPFFGYRKSVVSDGNSFRYYAKKEGQAETE